MRKPSSKWAVVRSEQNLPWTIYGCYAGMTELQADNYAAKEARLNKGSVFFVAKIVRGVEFSVINVEDVE